MNKELIKYGVLALGAYLVWKYIQDQGGLSAVIGNVTGTGPAMPVATTLPAHDTTPTPPAHVTTPPVYVPPVVPILDLTGLTVTRDINNSLAGTVKISGQPIRLAIIQDDGRIFDNSGSEVSATLAARGVDLNQLRNAFTVAGMGLSGFAPAYRSTAYWLN